MYPTSANFDRRIRQSGQRKTVVDVYYDGQQVTSNLPVTDGSIRVDLDGDVRRSGNITIADPALVPTFDLDTLSPLGTEIRVRQGIVYPDGTEELVPLGVFRLDVTSWSDAAGAVPAIQMFDRSKALTVQIGSPISRSGWLASDAIIDIVQYFYPWMKPIDASAMFDLPNLVDYRLPGGQVWDSGTHWEMISEVAKNMGGQLYFDVDGSPRVTPLKDLNASTPLSAAVLDITVGTDGILVDAQHTWSREGIYNAVTVVGATPENGNAPSATAYNNDPASPLRWGGPFGRVGTSITDATLTTQLQCEQRANAELRKATGASYSIDFTAVPNPALDVGDICLFRYLDGKQQLHQISTLTIPLGGGQFTGSSKGMTLG